MKLNIQLFADGGKVIIKTGLDTKEFDKEYNKMLEKADKKNIEIDFKIKNVEEQKKQLKEVDKRINDLEKQWGEYLDLKAKLEELEYKSLSLTGGEGDDYKNFGKFISLVENGNTEAIKLSNEMDKVRQDIDAIEREYAGVGIQFHKLEQEADLFNEQHFEIKESIKQELQDIENLKLEHDNLVKSAENYKKAFEKAVEQKKIEEFFKSQSEGIKGVVKKISKWALAIFGVRTAYNAIRSAMNTLMQYDPQLRANVDYITFALANTLKPVIEWIIRAIYTILGLLGGLVKMVTGFNIFKNSGIKDFQNTLGASNKSAKELKKTLAGFDEMNVLQDNSGGGNAGAGGAVPNLGDLATGIDDQAKKIESAIDGLTVRWFELGDSMKEVLDNPQLLTQTFGQWDLFIQGIIRTFYGLWEVIEGTMEFFGGQWDMWIGIFTGDWKKAWTGFKTSLHGLWLIFKGTADMILGALETSFGLVKGLVLTLWDWIKEVVVWIADKILWLVNKGQELFGKFWDWISSKLRWITDSFGEFGKSFRSHLEYSISFVKELFSGWFNGIKKGAQAVISFFKGDFKSGIKNTFESLKSVVLAPVNALISGINTLIKGLNKMNVKIPKALGGGSISFNIPQLPKLAKGGIVNLPGKGVPVGNAITGERRPEGVVPLTDTQQMALLGEAIGKYVRIDNVIDVNMDSRKIKRILAESGDRTRLAGNGYVR